MVCKAGIGRAGSRNGLQGLLAMLGKLCLGKTPAQQPLKRLGEGLREAARELHVHEEVALLTTRKEDLRLGPSACRSTRTLGAPACTFQLESESAASVPILLPASLPKCLQTASKATMPDRRTDLKLDTALLAPVSSEAPAVLGWASERARCPG